MGKNCLLYVVKPQIMFFVNGLLISFKREYSFSEEVIKAS